MLPRVGQKDTLVEGAPEPRPRMTILRDMTEIASGSDLQ
jgi:hypothetical protein